MFTVVVDLRLCLCVWVRVCSFGAFGLHVLVGVGLALVICELVFTVTSFAIAVLFWFVCRC